MKNRCCYMNIYVYKCDYDSDCKSQRWRLVSVPGKSFLCSHILTVTTSQLWAQWSRVTSTQNESETRDDSLKQNS